MATTVTRADFLEHFSAFNDSDPDLVDKKLAMAHRQLSETIWGELYADGVRTLTARLLALEPEGRKMRLQNKDGSTIYDTDWTRLRRMVSSGGRVV